MLRRPRVTTGVTIVDNKDISVHRFIRDLSVGAARQLLEQIKDAPINSRVVTISQDNLLILEDPLGNPLLITASAFFLLLMDKIEQPNRTTQEVA